VRAIVALVPAPATLLDIGCGDGSIARGLTDRWRCKTLGVDNQPRSDAVVPVQQLDAARLPFADGQFELVLLSDVLHHSAEALALLREALRMVDPRGWIVVKDHVSFGLTSRMILRTMDLVGNLESGVGTRGSYRTFGQWEQLVGAAGGTIDQRVWPMCVHDLPWRIVARSEYQLLLRVVRGGSMR